MHSYVANMGCFFVCCKVLIFEFNNVNKLNYVIFVKVLKCYSAKVVFKNVIMFK